MPWRLRAGITGTIALVCMTGSWILPAAVALVMLGAYAFTG